jgi:F5/8 type C domain
MSVKEVLQETARAWFFPVRTGPELAPRQREAMKRYLEAGEARARAAPGDVDAEMLPVAVGLLRDAVLCLLRALDHATHPELEPPAGAPPVEVLDASGLLPPTNEGAALVRAALEVADPLAFDRMSAEDLERLKPALEALVAKLRGRIDLRTAAHVRLVGRVRLAGVALLVLYGVVSVGTALFKGDNVALGRPVQVSSRHPGTPDPAGLVDGVVGGSYGAHTQVGQGPPWIVVDLQQPRKIRRIVVYNRGDVNLDQCLPYSVSVSEDGQSYRELAKRETHFGSGDFLSSPWTVKCDARARFVKVQAKDYIALSELEVFE